MADDDIDVKAEGQARTKRQQQGMRDTAEDEEYARTRRTQKGWNKDRANKHEDVDIMTSEPRSNDRKRLMRRDEYLIKTTADSKARSRKAGKKKVTRKRVSGK